MNENSVSESVGQVKVTPEQARSDLQAYLRQLKGSVKGCGVSFYPEGMVMKALRKVGNPTGKGGGIRGTVQTFSVGSRRRFRETLLKNQAKDGWASAAITLTIPGPVVKTEEARSMFAEFSLRIERRGWLLIWRAEVQTRGQMHWHCLLSANPAQVPESEAAAKAHYAGFLLKHDWFDVLDGRYGMVTYPKAIRIGDPREHRKAVAGPLSWWPGADSHCVSIECAGSGRSGWYRYLSDHASKVKKEQVGFDIGRHWGVVGRKHLVKLVGRDVDLNVKAYARFRRAYERMATPSVNDDRAPFGRRLGWRCKRGRWGSSVCFGKTATFERLVKYATS